MSQIGRSGEWGAEQEKQLRKAWLRHWTYMQQYADAKTGVIDEILERSPER